jgi:outer membrane receptor protein involved in Fe transport
MRRALLVLIAIGVLAAAAPLVAQENEPENLSPEEVAKAEEEGQVRLREEVTVVSASRVESRLVDAPATMSVVTTDVLETSPAQNYADLLRSVPGMNAIQTSARDLNLTTRQATSTLNNSQLVLVDGRSVYLDFFGLVLWDLIPTSSMDEIKQIEVVRGPASVVWGANALSGVVNIITKSPREHQGFGFTLNGGLFNRDGGSRESDGSGNSYGGSFFFADAPNDTWSYKLSAGYLSSDPYSRPVGTVPLSCHPYGVDPCRDAEGGALPGGFPLGGAPYPTETQGGGNFVNSGTSQPKVDLRIDQDVAGGGRITYQGGYAGTEGIIHTGIGPFDIQSDSYLAYGKVLYQKGALRIGGFGNFLDASAPNLLQVDPDSLPPEGGVPSPVVLGFKTQTYDVEIGNTSVIGGRHAVSYGGNYRRNNFDITLASNSKDRNEFGAYVQEEFFLDKFRIAGGLRVDKFGNLDKAVWSPRVSVMFKPTPDHSIRASYNRAFRSPSTINNFLDQNISNPDPTDMCAAPVAGVPPGVECPLAFALDYVLAPGLGLGDLVPRGPFLLTVNTFGNEALKEEHVDAIEIAYTGTFGGRTTVSLAVYQNDIDENINFTFLTPDEENPEGLPGLEYYTPTNPARGIQPIGGGAFRPITISPFLMAALPPDTFPWKVANYLNLGPLRNRGLEASIRHQVNNEIQVFANYSWQREPEILDAAAGQIRYPISEVGVPAKSRFNVGLSYDGPRLLANANVNYSSKALWTDVLSSVYHGYTDAYTMLNATIGVRLADGKATLSLRGTNLTNEEILQHIYGDLLRRSLVAELSFFTR